MKAPIGLLFYYSRSNRYSFNALAGALDTHAAIAELPVRFATAEAELLSVLQEVRTECDRTVLGISFATTQLRETASLVGRLRPNLDARTLLVAGGPHPTGDSHGSLRIGFDVVVTGEGEQTFLSLVEALMLGSDYRGLPGIAYLDDAQGHHWTGPAPPVDLDRYPPFSERQQRFGPIEITRGCPFACGYCQTSHIFGARPRHRSVEKVARCVSQLRQRGLSDIRVITPNAFSYGSADGRTTDCVSLEALLSSMRAALGPEGRIYFGSFPSEVRPEHVTKETVGLVRQYADNDNLIIGAQSGSERLLRSCNRGHSAADILNAVTITLRAGLKANVDFIFGLPGEGDEDLADTLRLMEELLGMRARIHAHTFIPLPQTRFALAPPGRLKPKLLRILERLASSGALYGDWRDQEKQARQVSDYRRTGRAGD